MHQHSDREVIRCKTCGLVQYRARTDYCRRCLRLLPPNVESAIPNLARRGLPNDGRKPIENWSNRQAVENIGRRVRELREWRGMTQQQVHAGSSVSRSYLSRIESGRTKPNLKTLIKISEALDLGLDRFFGPESTAEALMQDPFIQELRPFLPSLDDKQRLSILEQLAEIR